MCVVLASTRANKYMLKVSNINTRKKCEIYWNLTIKALEQRQWCRSGVFIVNFEHISRFFLVFIFLTLNRLMFVGTYCLEFVSEAGICYNSWISIFWLVEILDFSEKFYFTVDDSLNNFHLKILVKSYSSK